MVRAVIRVGDEVVCVDAATSVPKGEAFSWGEGRVFSDGETGLVEGRVYTVLAVGLANCGEPGLNVGEGGPCCGPAPGFLKARRFRKVQRRDLQAWLKTAVPAPHLDKRREVVG